MAKEMLINVSEGEECRIAIVEDAKLEELYMERASSTSHVGNIYKGRVTNVEPSIQAAFVDFGMGRNGFLHISDLMPQYFGKKGEEIQESVGRKLARRDRPPIQRCLRRGDDIIVQIIKEGIGTKGPTLSTYVSIPGRILVMMPGMSKFGVSRKIEEEEERRRLRTILDSLKPIKDVGFIIRTAGIGKSKTEIQRDLMYLTRLWQTIEKKLKLSAPQELYTEGDLVTRTVRDVFSSDIEHIVVDNKEVARKIKEFFKIAMPRTRNKVDLYEEPIPLFHKYRIEKEIELMYSRHVPLPSGGSLVIDSTEAIVAIDVNSGKFRDHSDAEMTAFKTDMEAADEIPRQLRLRDLGGVIICDFIDLRYERHRRDLEKRLHDNLRDDRAKTKVLRMSQFGIIEMTRQRMRPSLKRSIYFDCPHCKGSGLVKTPESMSLDVMRRLAIAVNSQRVSRVELSVCQEVAFYLLNRKRSQIANLETLTHKKVLVRGDTQLALDEVKMDLFDSRDGLVLLEELGMSATPPTEQRGRRPHPPPRAAEPRGRPSQRPEPAPSRHDIESVEDDIDQREETRDIETAAAIDAMESAPNATAPQVVADDAEAVDESNVIEIEEPSEPVGEAPQEMDLPGDGGRHRRRRGRRGRGRGRGRETAPNQPLAVPPSAELHEQADDHGEETGEFDAGPEEGWTGAPSPAEPGEAEPPSESGGRRRRRRRGGRRHRRRHADASSPANSNGEPPDQVAPLGDRATAQSSSPRGNPPLQPPAPKDPRRAAEPARHAGQHRVSPSRVDVPPTVKTGSTDRHLRDEPVELDPPARRPKTYRELDDVPEDY